MIQNIKHVDHVIWICKAENLDAYSNQLSDLSGVRLDGPWLKVNLGINVYISWETGLEIIAPVGEEQPFAVKAHEHLRTHGEGLFAVVFGVRDILEAREHAKKLGYEPSELIEQLGDEPWFDKTDTMKEVLVGDFINSLFVYGQITYPDGVIEGR